MPGFCHFYPISNICLYSNFDTFYLYKQFFKRTLDFVVAGLVLACISPGLIIVYLLVKADSEGHFFFMQDRIGRYGNLFKVYKIRTMNFENEVGDREIFRGHSEVTRVGEFLRRFKLDELPQLLNVLKGDMSLVGPRPGMPAKIPELNADGKFRLLVRPGLTGLAQINGNIYLSWPQRWKYDRQYVTNLSFWLDIRIIFKTFLIILHGEKKFLKKTDA
ncbi:MAG: sugar transferase [Chitinophagaceae bacterium]